MKVKVKPSGDKEELKQNLKNRVEKVVEKEEELVLQCENPDFLTRTPGIEKFSYKDKRKEGIGGKPVQKRAYARLESKRDAVNCLLATIKGYDLIILDTNREWDLRNLKKFNPDIKNLRAEKPPETLEIEYALFDDSLTEEVEIDMPEDEEVLQIYREMLT